MAKDISKNSLSPRLRCQLRAGTPARSIRIYSIYTGVLGAVLPRPHDKTKIFRGSFKKLLSILLLTTISSFCIAEDKIELQTTTIKGNKELPKILYIVPWKDIKPSKKNQQELVLHSLFGDLFDPVLPVKKLQ